jgi:Anti-sigma factor NepR
MRIVRAPNTVKTVKTSAAAEPVAEHAVGADLRAHLGAQLRAIYQEVVIAPVPRRFQRLLEDLAREEGKPDEQ